MPEQPSKVFTACRLHSSFCTAQVSLVYLYNSWSHFWIKWAVTPKRGLGELFLSVTRQPHPWTSSLSRRGCWLFGHRFKASPWDFPLKLDCAEILGLPNPSLEDTRKVWQELSLEPAVGHTPQALSPPVWSSATCPWFVLQVGLSTGSPPLAKHPICSFAWTEHLGHIYSNSWSHCSNHLSSFWFSH